MVRPVKKRQPLSEMNASAGAAAMALAVDPRGPWRDLCRYGPVIRINVGKDHSQESFYVQEAVLRKHSVFFRKALSGDWKEKVERVVNLFDDEPIVFAVYADFLTRGTLAVTPDGLDPVKTARFEQLMLCKVYVLSEKLLDVYTKNRAIQGLLHSTKSLLGVTTTVCPNVDAINVIYDATLPNSMARKLMVDFYTYRGTKDMLKNDVGWPEDFLLELATNFMGKHIMLDDPTMKGLGADYMEKE